MGEILELKSAAAMQGSKKRIWLSIIFVHPIVLTRLAGAFQQGKLWIKVD